jgi:23S rRNA (uracil1939-C5)-methyltransferase
MLSMNTDLAPGALIECTLSSLEYGGHACVKHEGALLYVPRGVPGDRVKLRVKKLRHNFGSAAIEEIISPSRDRVEPTCPAFREGCGGCQWLHISYPAQVGWKMKILQKTMHKGLGVMPDVKPIAAMREPAGFRNKLSLLRDGQGRFGFMKENSKTLVYFDRCPMELPLLQRIHHRLVRLSFPPAVEQVHVRGTRSGASLVMYADRPSPAFQKTAKILERAVPGLESIALRTRAGLRILAGLPFVSQRVGKLEFRIPPDSFFQTNYFQALALLETARRLLDLRRTETLLDLYCGVGFFAMDAANAAGRVVGIEADRAAVEAARLSARLNRIGNAEFRAVPAAAGLRAFSPGDVDALILDPPRSGCEEPVIREILRLRPRRIVYISCEPETLTRECARLIERGYLLGEIVPVDMFPHTYHIEASVKLVAR